ncbi:MAG: Plug domain-containing protein [Gammaproteobacteria bacterium]|nr:Plug domain-containing protein [Gammaproteobacteria bacterium]
MKRLLIAVSATFAMVAAGAVSGPLAQEAEPEEQAREQAREARKDKEAERFCIQETGSRIIANRNARSNAERKECVAAGGRVYTREEIERTGSTNLRDALRKLDPAIH